MYYFKGNSTSIGNVPIIINGFSSVLYSSDGTKPQYINNNFALNKELKNDIGKSNDNLSCSKIKDKENEYRLTPKQFYNNGEINNYLKIYNAAEEENATIVLHKPILFLYNRYENANLNGWDGSTIKTENGHILAPQVGAGFKENDNAFTGIVIGLEKENNNTNAGLFGYNKGQRSIFLDAKTGAATFGLAGSGGQIQIKPGGDAIIKSSDYDPTAPKKGMGIKFNNDPYIKFGNGNFEVNSKGHLTAKGGGSIAGWTIGDTALTKGQVGISSDNSNNTNIAFWAGNTTKIKEAAFRVDFDGKLFASSADIKGKITATSGYFDDCTIENCTITNTCKVAGETISGTIAKGTQWEGSAVLSDFIGNLPGSKLTSGTVKIDYSRGTVSITDSSSTFGTQENGNVRIFANSASIQTMSPIKPHQAGGAARIGNEGNGYDFYGTFHGSIANTTSSREKKANIKNFEIKKAIDIIKRTNVVSYNYKSDFFNTEEAIKNIEKREEEYLNTVPEEEVGNEYFINFLKDIEDSIEYEKSLPNTVPLMRYGFISEDAPEELVSKDRKSVDTYSAVAMSFAAIQVMLDEIDNLKAEIKELKGEE